MDESEGLKLYQEKRFKKIMLMLEDKGEVSTQEIVEQFGISRDTARRDIIQLVENGKVIRTHGGIIMPEEKLQVLNYFERLNQLSQEKQRMAQLAVKQIQPNSVCFIDVSTTLLQVAQNIKVSCQIYTHALDNAFVLANQPLINLTVLGGKFDDKNRFFYGEEALEQIGQVKFDLSLIGAASLEEDGFYFKEKQNARIKRKVIQRTRKVVLISEQQKFQKQSTFRGGEYEDIDVFITDQELKPNQLALFEKSTNILY